MTTTACLPECERNCWTGQDKHAFGCPVAAMFGAAEQAYFGPRAPQADVSPGSEWQREAEENGRRLASKPAPQAEDGGKVGERLRNSFGRLACGAALRNGQPCMITPAEGRRYCAEHSKLAPAPIEQPRTAAGDVVEQGSAESIDWDAAKASSESWAKGRPLPHDLKCTPAQETLGRAYVALRAEVEDLKRKIEVLESDRGRGASPDPRP